MTKIQRLTKQKTLIMEILLSTDSHPSADWIYQEARKTAPGISLGTVYRNLSQMRDNGSIVELRLRDGQRRYDSRTDRHYHFCCVRCSGVYDVKTPVAEAVREIISHISEYRVTDHQLEFYGLCVGCTEATAQLQ